LNFCTGYSVGFDVENRFLKYVKSLSILKHKNFTGALEFGRNGSLVKVDQGIFSILETNKEVYAVKNDYFVKLFVDTSVNERFKLYSDLLYNFPNGEKNEFMIIEEYKLNDDTTLKAKVSIKFSIYEGLCCGEVCHLIINSYIQQFN